MSRLSHYAKQLVAKAGKTFDSGEVFAKVLTRNDDSGRHGVLIPTDAYSYFPELPIPDSTQNATQTFIAFNTISSSQVTLAYKYYERYPERRITKYRPRKKTARSYFSISCRPARRQNHMASPWPGSPGFRNR